MFTKMLSKKINLRTCAISIFLLILSLFFWETAFADLPQQIFFQAKITTTGGTIATGTHSVTFRLYTASSGGTPLWTETQSITADSSGIISCYLGSSTVFPESLDYNTTYYLSIEVDSGGEMSPRVKMVPSFSALNADRFDGLDSGQFLRSDTSDSMEGPLSFTSYITQSYTGTSADAFNMNFNPASGTYDALDITYGSAGGTGTALKVTQSGTGDILKLYSGSTGVFAVNDDGNVGIGTVSPATLLDVNSKFNVLSGGNVGVGTASPASLFDVNSKFNILSSGNVGIGTVSPSARLHIKADGASTGTVLRIQDSTGTNKIVVLDNGNVGIGTTSPSSFKLEMAGSIGPSADSTYDLGSNTVRWANIYADNLYGNITPIGLTEGGITFSDADGALVQDAVNLFWDNTNNFLGIGTSNPTAGLTVGTGTNNNATSATDVYITGNLEVDGSTWLGDAAADTLTVTGTFTATDVDMTINSITVNNDLNVKGNTTLGDNINDTLTVNAGALSLVNASTLNLATSTTALNIESGLLNLDTQNLKLGIGTTAPTAGITVGTGTNNNATSATDVYITGNLEVDGSTWLGDAAADTLTISGSLTATNTSMSLQTLTVSGNTYLATTSGNVGIGTTNPGAALAIGSDAFKVTGAGIVTAGTWNGSAIADAYIPNDITIDGTDNVTWASVNKAGSSLADLITRSAGDLASGNLAVARMPVSGNWALTGNLGITGGKLGIGTTAPTAGITVGTGTNNNATSATDVYVTGNLEVDGSTWLGDAAADTLTVTGTFTATDVDMTINSITVNNDLNVKGNTTLGDNINDTLTVNAGALSLVNASTLNLATSGTALNIESGLLNLDTQSTRVGIGTTAPAGLLQVGTSPNAPLLVSASGNVGIGTTGPAYNLEVASTGYFGGDVKIGTGTFNNASGSSDLYVTGNLEVDGSTWLGDAAADTLTVVGSLTATGADMTIGNLSVNGDAVIGDNSADSLTVNAATLSLASASTLDLAASTTALNIESGLLNLDTQNRKLGIGTTAPTAGITVGTGTNNNATSATDVYVTGNLEVDGSTWLGDAAADTLTVTGTFTATDVDMTINSITVNNDLNVKGDTTLGDNINDTLTVNAGALSLVNASTLNLATSGTALNIESGLLNLDTQSTRVGIGTTAPGAMLDVSGGSIRTNNQLISTVAGGTAPLSVISNTLVNNLNADLLDGQEGSYYLAAGNISGTTNYMAKFTDTTSLGNSSVFDNGNVGIGTTNPNLAKLTLQGAATIAATPSATDSDGTIYLGKSAESDADHAPSNGSEYLMWDDNYLQGAKTGWFYFSGPVSMTSLNVRNPSSISFGTSTPQTVSYDETGGASGSGAFTFSKEIVTEGSSPAYLTFAKATGTAPMYSLAFNPDVSPQTLQLIKKPQGQSIAPLFEFDTTGSFSVFDSSGNKKTIISSGTNFKVNPQNLIRSGSFETTWPTGWNPENGTVIGTNLDIGTTGPGIDTRFGVKYLRIKDTSASASYGASFFIPDAARFRGRNLTLSIFARAASGTQNAAVGYQFDNDPIVVKKLTLTTTWANTIWTFPDTVPTDCTTIKFYLFGNNGTAGNTLDVTQTNSDWVFFDGVSLVEGSLAVEFGPSPITDTGDQVMYGNLAVGAGFDPYQSGNYYAAPRITFGEPDSYYGSGYGGYGMGAGEIRFLRWGGSDAGRFEFNRPIRIFDAMPSTYGASFTVNTEAGAGPTTANQKGDAYVSGRIEIGGTAPGTALIVGTAGGGVSIDNAVNRNDAYIKGNLEVDGTIYGVLSSTSSTFSSITVTGNSYLSTNAGANTGIGTTNPSQRLHVAGNMRLTGALYDNANEVGVTGQVLSTTGTGVDWVDASSLPAGNADTLDSIDSTGFLRSDVSTNFSSTAPGATLTISSGATLDVAGDLSVADTNIALTGTSVNLNATGDLSVNSDDFFVKKTTGNVGIGTTAPGYNLEVASAGYFGGDLKIGTGTFNNPSGAADLYVTGNIEVDGSSWLGDAAADTLTVVGTFNATNTSMTLQTLSVTGDTVLGDNTSDTLTVNAGNLILANASTLNLANASTTALNIESGLLTLDTQNTRVGIGTTNPLATLDISGQGRITGGFGIGATPDSTASLRLGERSSLPGAVANTNVIYRNQTNDYLGIVTGTTQDVLVIKDDGNVGIGTTGPGYKLEVNGNSLVGNGADITPDGSANGQLNIQGNGYKGRFMLDGSAMHIGHYSAARGLSLMTNQASRVFITSGGNVGIGTTNPSDLLQVAGNANIGRLEIDGGAFADSSGSTLIQFGDIGANFTRTAIHDSSGEVITLKSGNVGIGTTNPGSYKLYVNGDTYIGGVTVTNGNLNFGGNLDMQNNFITNIGNANTDFTSGGGLNLAGNLAVNTDKLFVNASSGNVGIGTTGPSAKLDITGNLFFSGTTPTITTKSGQGLVIDTGDVASDITIGRNVYFRDDAKAIQASNADGRYLAFQARDSGVGLVEVARLQGAADPYFQAGSLYAMYSGNVGIGTTDPNYALEVASTGYFGGDLKLGTGTFNNASGAADLYVTGNLEVDGSAWLGDAAADTLTVVGSLSAANADMTLNSLTVNGNSVLGDNAGDTLTVNAGILSLANASTLNLANTSTTSLNIESGLLNLDTQNSRVGIGTTGPNNKLDVVVTSGISSTTTNGVAISDGAANRTLIHMGVNTGNYIYIQANQENVAPKNLALNPEGGNVGIGTTAPNSMLHMRSTDPRIRFTDTDYGAPSIDLAGWSSDVGGNHTGFDINLLTVGSSDDALVRLFRNTNTSGLTAFRVMTGDNTNTWNTQIAGQGGDTYFAALSGNVGVGTTAPGYNLEVASTGYFGGDVKIGTGTFNNASGASDLYVTGNLEVDGSAWLGDAAADTLTVVGSLNATNTSMTLQSLDVSGNAFLATAAGNVGIGTTNPATLLEVAGNARAAQLQVDSAGIYIDSSGSNMTLTDPTAGTLNLVDLSGGPGGGGSAPKNATYITQTPNNTLTNEQALSTLATGYMKVTTTSGVISSQAAPIPVADGGTGTANGSITGTGALTFTAGGSNQNVRLTPSGTGYTILDGNVGIGTTNPGAKLEVNGNIYIPNNAQLRFGPANGEWIQNAQWGLAFYGGGGERVRINSASGNFGIGTTNPGQKLEVNGDANIGDLQFRTNVTGADDRIYSNGYLRLNAASGVISETDLIVSNSGKTYGGTGASNSLYLRSTTSATKGNVILADDGGNVGIGTTEPLGLLQVGTSPNAPLLVMKTGKVGIFNTAPTAGLTVGVGVNNNATSTQDVYIAGKLEVDGSSWLGDAGVDTLTVTGTLSAANADLTIRNLTVNDNTTLGNAAGDSLTINAADLTLANASTLNIANSSTTALNIESGLLNLDTQNTRVGIGTIAPLGLLQVGTSPNAPLLVMNNGKVGIGNTAPQAGLTVGVGVNNNATSTQDVYIAGKLEVDGSAWLGDAVSDTLTVVGSLTATSADMTIRNLTVNDDTTLGSAAGDSLTINAATLTLANASTLDIVNALTTALNIESGLLNLDTQNLRVGIGTTAPQNKLEIVSASGAPQLRLTYDTTNSATITAENDGDLMLSPKAGSYLRTSNPFSFAGGTIYMNNGLIQDIGSADTDFTSGGGLNVAGNTGIGTTVPLQKLEVGGSAVIGNHANGLGVLTVSDWSGSGKNFGLEVLDVSGNSRFAVKNDGSVGIGTTAPLGLLQVGTSPNAPLLVMNNGKVGIGNTAPQAGLTVGVGVNNNAITTSDVYIAGKLEVDGSAWLGDAVSDTLTVVGSLTATSADMTIRNLTVNDDTTLGSAAGDSLTINAAALTLANASTLNIANSSTTALNIESGLLNLDTQSLRVGIGTTSPGALLHLVGGNMAVGSGAADTQRSITIYGNGTNPPFVDFIGQNSGQLLRIIGKGSGSALPAQMRSNYGLELVYGITGEENGFRIVQNTTPIFQVLSGNVGIGTTSPSEKLNLQGEGARLVIKNGTGTTYSYTGHESGAGGFLQLYDAAGAMKIRLDGAGDSYFNTAANVGIGTTAPLGLLQVGTSPNAPLLVMKTGKVGIFNTAPTAGLTVGVGTNNNATSTQDVYIAGRLEVDGSTWLGDAEVDTLTVFGSLTATSTDMVIRNLTVDDNTILGNAGADSVTINAANLTLANASTLDIANASTTALNIESGLFNLDTQSLRVGIGTTSPQAKLNIFASNGPYIALGQGASATLGNIGWSGAGENRMFLGYSTNEHLDIFSNGNVGINLTSLPGTKFQVNGNASIGYSTGGGAASNGLSVSGNVGIGTTAPTVKLQVDGGQIRASDSYITATQFIDVSNGSYFLDPDNTTKSLTVAGNVGIGTTAPLGLLQVGTSPNAPLLVTQAGKVGIFNTAPTAGLTVGVGTNNNATSTQDVYIAGKLEVDGSSWLGDAGVDTLTVTGTLSAANADLTIRNLTVNDNTTLGNAAGDSLTINAAALSLANASTLDIANSSTTALNIESGLLNLDTQSLRVGIGTTAPSDKLEVVGGSIQVDNNRGISSKLTPGAGGNVANLAMLDSSNNLIFGTSAAANSLQLRVNSATARMYIDSSGNVGIGTATPVSLLDVDSKLNVFSGGNVGIGTTNPSYKLDVSGTFRAQNTTIAGTIQTTEGANLATGSGNVGIGTTAPLGLLQVGTSPNAPLLVTQAGKVGIFNTAPTAGLTVGVGTNNNATSTQDVYIAGKLEVDGSAWLGDAVSDTLTVVGSLTATSADMTIRNLTVNDNTTLGNAAGDSLTINAAALSLANASTLDIANSSTTALNIESGLLNLDTQNTRVGIGTIAPLGTLQVGASPNALLLVMASGNIGIGTTAPTAKLEVAGGDALFSNGKGVMVKNSVGSNGYVIYRGTDDRTYVGQSGWNGPTAFPQNGDVWMVYNGGNVGIGTTAPNAKLEVAGQALASYYRTNTANTEYNQLTRNGGGAALYINQVDNTNPILRLSKGTATANGNVVFTVENTGKVGIGNTNPVAGLTIGNGTVNNATADSDLYVAGKLEVDGSSWLGDAGVDTLTVTGTLSATNASMTLKTLTVTEGAYFATSSGNVGIGTASPSQKLHVMIGDSGATGELGGWAIIENNADGGLQIQTPSTNRGILYFGSPADADIAGIGYDHANGYLYLRSNNDNTLTVKSGNVGIATTNPGYKLQVDATNASIIAANAISGYGGIDLLSAGTSKLTLGYAANAGNYGAQTAAGDVSIFAKNTNMHFLTGPGNANTAVYINTSGNVGIGTTNPGAKLEINGGHLLVQNGKIGVGVVPGASSESLEVSGSIKLTGRIRQGSLGDLAEMIPLASCVLNPKTAALDAPEALIKGENDKTPLILKNKEEYRNYVLSQPEAGDVVVISEDGGVMRSYESFATSAVGIISTNPAQVLRDDLENAAPVVLSGIVPCKVTAENGKIKPGDLLASSSTPGHAMRAGQNPPQGTVIGKALSRLDDDVGVVEVIVMMQ